ncbi:MAG: tripartite tricarboxylate transporter permease [Deltaproteobacteria bacterium]|nr:tripartite tricarboxylate transporter permease [Deltaproteobacteria bacterium]
MGWDTELLLKLIYMAFGWWWIIIPAVILGTIVGAVPGFNAQNVLVMLLPLTLAMKVELALVFMASLYCATHLGGGIPAILVNIPGTGGAAATTIDGYAMAKKGQAQQALVLSFTSSVFGGLITSIAVVVALPYLVRLSYYVRSVEMVVIILFGLALIAVIAAKDMLKGLIAGFLGLLIGAIGADNIYSTPRATFGFLELYDGVPLVPALIGLFAISEALAMLEEKTILTKEGQERAAQSNWADTIEGLTLTVRHWWLIVWTGFVGLIIGIIPGAGASIAAFVAYQQARTFSKTPELFGTGIPEGVLAPESANNGVTSGTLVPLMAIGVPGGSTAAVMMIVLQYHGIVLGPRLFLQNPALAYGVFVAMVVAYIFMIFTIIPLARYMARVTLIPTQYLAAIIAGFTIVGAYAPRAYLFDMGLALAFGILGYVARKTDYHVTAILIGVILGPLFETYLMRALRISQGDILILFSSTVGNVLWIMLVLSIAMPYFRQYRMQQKK